MEDSSGIIESILLEPFLLIQIGDYGHGYDSRPIPVGLNAYALQRLHRGEQTYPRNNDLPAPHFHVPYDVSGILMNKSDEINILGFAYWAQTLSKRVHKKGCMNSSPDDLFRVFQKNGHLHALLVTKKTTSAPKGNKPGRFFERWTKWGYIGESPTYQIDTDYVYTEAAKSTIVFNKLETISAHKQIDLNQFHVFFASNHLIPEKYIGKKLPYRPSMYGSCSLLIKGSPDNTDMPLLKANSSSRKIVAVGSIHPHICGRVRA